MDIWVRLSVTPAAAPKVPGSLRLVHAGGGYDSTLAIASNFVANGDEIDLLFKTVPQTNHYSLTYIGADGTVTTIFSDVPFSTLNDYSPPSKDLVSPPGS
jgi:hypothetical protein